MKINVILFKNYYNIIVEFNTVCPNVSILMPTTYIDSFQCYQWVFFCFEKSEIIMTPTATDSRNFYVKPYRNSQEHLAHIKTKGMEVIDEAMGSADPDKLLDLLANYSHKLINGSDK